MARRQSVFEDLIDITSRLPWWVGMTLTLISYLILHGIAESEIKTIQGLEGMGENVRNQLFKSLASIGQYLLPFIFTLGAILSFFGRLKRHNLLASTNTPKSQSIIGGISWQDFELLVGEAFRKKGYKVTETPSGADGGIDLILTKSGEKTLVQCKHWRSRRVGVKVTRELYGVMVAHGAEYGVVVASGEYTEAAVKFASTNHIELVNGTRLTDMIRSAQQPTINTAKKTHADSPSFNGASLGAAKKPICPKCNTQMIKRTAKRGDNAGQLFWGCSSFPKCRETKHLL
jgi:restriction system protein